MPQTNVNQVLPKLTDAQFEALAKISRLRVGSDKYAALYQVTVNGTTIGDAARLTGMAYSAAWTAVNCAQNNINLCKIVACTSKRV